MGFTVACVAAFAAAPPVADPLPQHALFRLGSNHLRSSSAILDVALSPDGRVAAAAGHGTSVSVWNLPSGGRKARLEDPAGRRPSSLAFSPNGKLLVAAAGYDKSPHNGLCVWAVEGGLLRAAASVPGEVLTAMSFSPSGKLIAAARPGELLLFDATTGRKLRSIEARPGGGRIAFSPCGTLLAVPTDSCAVTLFRVDTGEPVRTLPGVRDRPVYDLAFSPDGRSLAAILQESGVRVWDVRTGKPQRAFPLPSQEPHCRLRFAAGGREMVALDGKGSLVRLDARSGKELSRWSGRLEGHHVAAGFADDAAGPVLIGDCWTRRLRLIDPRLGREIGEAAPGHPAPAARLAPSPDGRYLAAGSTPILRVWDLYTGRLVRELQGHTGSLDDLAWSPDGKRIASACGDDKAVRLWDARSERCLATLAVPDCYVPKLAFAPGGARLAVSGRAGYNGKPGQLGVWDIASATRLQLLDTAHSPTGLSFLDDATLAYEEREELRFRDVEEGGPALPSVNIPSSVWEAAVSADGGRRAFTGPEHTVRVLEGESGLELLRLPTPRLRCVFALSADGERLAMSTEPGRIGLYDVVSGARLAEFRHAADEMDRGLAFTPDGARLVSAGDDTTILVWDLRAAARGRPVAPLDAGAARKHWAALGTRDADAVKVALIALRADPRGAVRLVEAELLSAKRGGDSRRAEDVIADLDSDSFEKRKAAARDLQGLGEAARPALARAAREHASLEVRKRAAELLRRLGTRDLSEGDLRAVRAARLLERLGGPDARRALAKLAEGDISAPATRVAVAALRRMPG